MTAPAPLASRYSNWKAPQEDSSVLVWPAADQLLIESTENNRLLRRADAARIQNTPLSQLRQSLRQFLGFQNDDQLIVLNGHQSELHHPGVWAKNVLVHATAARTGGVAVHVSVDTDAPKHLTLRFPGYSRPFTDDENAGAVQWASLVAPPTPGHLAALESDVRAASANWPFRPAIDEFFAIARRLSLEAETLPAILTAALHEYDWKLGLRYTALLASPIWQSMPFLALVHHVLANADRFAADYNAALAVYRKRNGIKDAGRPMPNLAAKDDRCETPFWRDDLTRGRRLRAWVERAAGGRWALTVGDADRLELDPSLDAETAADRLLAFCRRHNLRLAPRALLLTLTLRLLAADQFVHGIGGAQYDQVTDEVIAGHFGIEPPRFAVTTATLYWPPAAGRRRTSVPELLQQGHRLKHGLLGERKMELVRAIDAAPRDSVERQARFQTLHREMSAAATGNGVIAKWEQDLREAATKVVEERALFDREIFYPLQSRERIQRAIDIISSQFQI